MAFNASSIKTSSDGIWQGENPLQYAFPLLIIQTTLVILMSRAVAFFLKPLRQPKVVAEIVVRYFHQFLYMCAALSFAFY